MINNYKVLHIEDITSDARLAARERKKRNISFDGSLNENKILQLILTMMVL